MYLIFAHERPFTTVNDQWTLVEIVNGNGNAVHFSANERERERRSFFCRWTGTERRSFFSWTFKALLLYHIFPNCHFILLEWHFILLGWHFILLDWHFILPWCFWPWFFSFYSLVNFLLICCRFFFFFFHFVIFS